MVDGSQFTCAPEQFGTLMGFDFSGPKKFIECQLGSKRVASSISPDSAMLKSSVSPCIKPQQQQYNGEGISSIFQHSARSGRFATAVVGTTNAKARLSNGM